MVSFMMTDKLIPDDLPLVVTIAGEQGVGKTLFSASWPKPVIVPIENGLRSIKEAGMNIPAFPIVNRSSDVMKALSELRTSSHDRKTVVLDSMTSLESMMVREMLEKGKSRSLAHLGGGYGAGYQMLKASMSKVVEAAWMLRNRMHVMFILQSEIETFSPEDSEPFDRLTVRCDKRLKEFFLDRPDLVGFIRERKSMEQVGGDKGKRVAHGTGERELICHKQPAVTSKNRMGIDAPLLLEIGVNPILNREKQVVASATSTDTSDWI